MALTKVTASVANDTTELDKEGENTYNGSLTAPDELGVYNVKVAAYDSMGNVSVASSALSVDVWHTPKTNWKSTDRFNYVDYNRIKSNLMYLYELSQECVGMFDILDMGDDITEYSAYFSAQQFNNFEKNLETINKNTLLQNIGTTKTFYDNGVFIKWDELNRIESAILELGIILEQWKSNIRHIPFKLGQFKEVRI